MADLNTILVDNLTDDQMTTLNTIAVENSTQASFAIRLGKTDPALKRKIVEKLEIKLRGLYNHLILNLSENTIDPDDNSLDYLLDEFQLAELEGGLTDKQAMEKFGISFYQDKQKFCEFIEQAIMDAGLRSTKVEIL